MIRFAAVLLSFVIAVIECADIDDPTHSANPHSHSSPQIVRYFPEYTHPERL